MAAADEPVLSLDVTHGGWFLSGQRVCGDLKTCFINDPWKMAADSISSSSWLLSWMKFGARHATEDCASALPSARSRAKAEKKTHNLWRAAVPSQALRDADTSVRKGRPCGQECPLHAGHRAKARATRES